MIRSFDRSPSRDLALEEALVREAPTDDPVLFLYGWDRPVLVLGHGQPPESVDLAACRALDVPVLRRITGGTGVLHGSDLAVSLVLPADHPWTGSIAGLYQRFLATLLLALEPLGVVLEHPSGPRVPRNPRSPICFEDDRGETLLATGRKAIGCAQARRRNRILVHGVLLRGVDAGLQARVYGVDPDRIRAALGPISLPPPARQAMADELVAAISRALHLRPVEEAPPPQSGDPGSSAG